MSQQLSQIKVVLLGNEGVGKTSLLRQWTSNVYDPNIPSTIGGAAQIKRDIVNGQQYSFQIWDTAGAERYRALAPLYVRDSYAAMIVFDMTRKSTFDNLDDWINFIHQHGEIPFIIIGNKNDLTNKIEVTAEEATNYAFSVESQFYETSAKMGINVDLAFRELEITAIDCFKRKGTSEQASLTLQDDAKPDESRSCC